MKSARIHPVARELAQYCHRLALAGLSPGGTGQVSVRDGDLIWVTPAGMNLGAVQAEHLILMWPGESSDTNPSGRMIADGEFALPTHFAWHQAFYAARPELTTTIQVRPSHTMAWASLYEYGEPSETEPPGFQQPVLLIPCQASNGAAAGAIPSSIEAAAQHHANIIAMANVGVFSLGASLADAFNALEELEACAATHLKTGGKAIQPVRIAF